MKIVHLITGLGTGGAERMLFRLVSAADRDQFEHVVVSMMDEGVLGDRIREIGIRLHTLNMNRGRPSLSAMVSLVRILRAERPDVLQTWLYHADLMGLVAGRMAGVPRIAWNIRCSDMEMRHYSVLSRLLVPALARLSSRPDVVLINSEAGRVLHERLGYRPRRWEMIPNGFDLSDAESAAAEPQWLRRYLGLPEDAVVVGLVARFDPMKDHRRFLEAAARLTPAHPDIFFVLVGKGVTTANPALYRQVDESGLGGRVFLLGERRDVPRIMRDLDILVSSSAYGEGFSNVIGEAMMAGVPCVATDTGDSRLIIGDTGTVVPPGDTDALAGALDAMIRHGPAERRALGEAARARIAGGFSLERIVERYSAVYGSLTGAPSAGGSRSVASHAG